MRKKIFLSILLSGVFALSAVGFAYTNGQNDTAAESKSQKNNTVQWMTNYTQALGIAKKENKPVLLFFTGSDWCGWCKKLDKEVFETSDFAQVAGDKFVFVKVDFPMGTQLSPELAKQNGDLKQQYGISGFPTVVLLSPDATFVAETGYRPGGGREYGQYLLEMLKSN